MKTSVVVAAAIIFIEGALFQSTTTLLRKRLVDSQPADEDATESSPKLRKRRLDSQPADEGYTEPKPQSSSEDEDTEGTAVAVLVSGQCKRFIYKDNPGPFFSSSNNISVDVFIGLQCGDNAFNKGSLDAPPYINTTALNITDIEDYYLHEKGARSVHVRVIDEPTMDDVIKTTLAHTTSFQQVSRFNATYVLDQLVTSIPYHRGGQEMRKFYSRHVSYHMSQQLGRTYDAFIALREDNYFYKPLDIDDIYMNRTDRMDANQPFVVVDQFCQWNAYSDKIHLVNKAAADLLFVRNYAELVARMRSYFLFTYYRKTGAPFLKGAAPHQIEAFLQDTLSPATVERANLWRVDARYSKGRLCAPQLYFDCLGDDVKQVSRGQGMDSCHDRDERKAEKEAEKKREAKKAEEKKEAKMKREAKAVEEEKESKKKKEAKKAEEKRKAKEAKEKNEAKKKGKAKDVAKTSRQL